MRESAHGQQSSFALWLRTGRWPDPDASAAIERKFNPWHDPDDGRFTFADQGRRYGSGSAGSSASGKPRKRDKVKPGGGSFGGAGATGAFGKPLPAKPEPKAKPKPTSRGGRNFPGWLPATPAPWPKPRAKPIPIRPAAPSPWRPVERNGYIYHLDDKGDPHEIDVPKLGTEAQTPRSRSAQRNAGKPDRLPTDDGGHFIAHRFNGPNDAFNHFAQDRASNRGRYRVVEQTWADAQAAGKDVSFKMKIDYPTGSRRPDFVHIWYSTGGPTVYEKIDNRPGHFPVKPQVRRKK
ncbi:DNA/RNA non-specific endonuclease [Blastomonas sp. SL216]|uniref:DNA/RNA non-specific endonuclease n=1 Tax=Blastomonas sp. SL216 TaxID=2995169 RepID=UPI0023772C9E|nr:DNA/RNA non-specific endonuclease [Blastomonas sp. SL216]